MLDRNLPDFDSNGLLDLNNPYFVESLRLAFIRLQTSAPLVNSTCFIWNNNFFSLNYCQNNKFLTINSLDESYLHSKLLESCAKAIAISTQKDLAFSLDLNYVEQVALNLFSYFKYLTSAQNKSIYEHEIYIDYKEGAKAIASCKVSVIDNRIYVSNLYFQAKHRGSEVSRLSRFLQILLHYYLFPDSLN